MTDETPLKTVVVEEFQANIETMPQGDHSYEVVTTNTGEDGEDVPHSVTIKAGKTRFAYEGRVYEFRGARIFPNNHGRDIGKHSEVDLVRVGDEYEGLDNLTLENMASMVENGELKPVGEQTRWVST